MRLGAGEILIVLVVVLLVFGPNKLPQLGDALGKGIRNFKKAASVDEPPSAAPVEGAAALPAAAPAGAPSARAGAAAARASIDGE